MFSHQVACGISNFGEFGGLKNPLRTSKTSKHLEFSRSNDEFREFVGTRL